MGKIEDSIRKSNENWLKEKKPKDPKSQRRINGLLESKHLRNGGWSGMNFKAVRG